MKLKYFLYNAFLVEDEKTKIAIDPGRNLWLFKLGSLIPKKEWETITHVLVTHGDPDHFVYAVPMAKKTGATVVCVVATVAFDAAAGATVVGVAATGTCSPCPAQDRTSSAVTRPPGPDPLTCAKSIPSSRASLLVAGAAGTGRPGDTTFPALGATAGFVAATVDTV